MRALAGQAAPDASMADRDPAVLAADESANLAAWTGPEAGPTGEEDDSPATRPGQFEGEEQP